MSGVQGFEISEDNVLLDREMIHGFISEESYWGLGRSREDMDKAIDNSAFCFGVFEVSGDSRRQVGFARLVSDTVTIGYLMDVFILPQYRGRGLGKGLLRHIMGHPVVSRLRRLFLSTNTPEFYYDSGFTIFEQGAQYIFMARNNG